MRLMEFLSSLAHETDNKVPCHAPTHQHKQETRGARLVRGAVHHATRGRRSLPDSRVALVARPARGAAALALVRRALALLPRGVRRVRVAVAVLVLVAGVDVVLGGAEDRRRVVARQVLDLDVLELREALLQLRSHADGVGVAAALMAPAALGLLQLVTISWGISVRSKHTSS